MAEPARPIGLGPPPARRRFVRPRAGALARRMLSCGGVEVSPMETSKTILVPIDFQDASLEALATARDLARRLDLEIVLLHTYTVPVVVYPGFDPIIAPGLPDKIATMAKGALAKLSAEHGGLRAIVRAGDPATEILKT